MLVKLKIAKLFFIQLTNNKKNKKNLGELTEIARDK